MEQDSELITRTIEGIFESPASTIFDQVETGLHTIKPTSVATIGR